MRGHGPSAFMLCHVLYVIKSRRALYARKWAFCAYAVSCTVCNTGPSRPSMWGHWPSALVLCHVLYIIQNKRPPWPSMWGPRMPTIVIARIATIARGMLMIVAVVTPTTIVVPSIIYDLRDDDDDDRESVAFGSTPRAARREPCRLGDSQGRAEKRLSPWGPCRRGGD
jgi:hypothetical protein